MSRAAREWRAFAQELAMAGGEFDLKSMDRRLVDRLVRRGEVSEKELEKLLKQLPDVAEEGAPFESKLEDATSQG